MRLPGNKAAEYSARRALFSACHSDNDDGGGGVSSRSRDVNPTFRRPSVGESARLLRAISRETLREISAVSYALDPSQPRFYGRYRSR